MLHEPELFYPAISHRFVRHVHVGSWIYHGSVSIYRSHSSMFGNVWISIWIIQRSYELFNQSSSTKAHVPSCQQIPRISKKPNPWPSNVATSCGQKPWKAWHFARLRNVRKQHPEREKKRRGVKQGFQKRKVSLGDRRFLRGLEIVG